MSSGPSIFNFFVSKNVHDEVKTPRYVEVNVEKQETGMDRLRTMFFLDKYGYQSKEMILITQSSYMSCFGGFIIGGIMQSREAYINFLENNQATKFANHLDAKRELQRAMYLSFMKGGWHWGWRIGMFSLTFTTLMTTIAAYRGKDSMVEYIVAGGATGGLFKLNMGVKGAAAGALVGTVLGGIGGSLSMLVLKIGGISMSDVRQFSKTLQESRENVIKETRKEYMLKEHTDMANRKADENQFLNLSIDEETK